LHRLKAFDVLLPPSVVEGATAVSSRYVGVRRVAVVALILALIGGLVVVITTIVSVALEERVLELGFVGVTFAAFGIGVGASNILCITGIFTGLAWSLLTTSAV